MRGNSRNIIQRGGRKAALACLLLAVAAGASAGEFKVQRAVPYAGDAIIAGNIKRECTIDQQLSDALRRASADAGNQVTLVESLDTASGQALKLEIVDAQSAGNAWMGHHKSVTVKGWLFRDGQEVAKFVARRNSGGGFGAGFKGSCSVLDRTVNAIGRAIAAWLVNPADGAQLGDLR